MTYLRFHLVFILPIIGVLALLVRRRALALPRPFAGIALLCLIAAIYTTPWDNHLIALGVWTHQPGRTLGLNIGLIPIEEFAFFFLQPLLVGLFILHLANAMPCRVAGWMHASWRDWQPRLVGACIGIGVSAGGALLLQRGDESWTYLGLILVWAGPVLAFQWGLGGNILWAGRAFLFTGVAGPTVYLWVVDMIAIEWEIWSISKRTSTGAFILALPIEEAVFFLVTNLMVVNGLMLYFRTVNMKPLNRT